MTLTNEDDAPSARVASAPHWHPRSDLDLIEQQLRAVERFNTARRMRQQAATATALSREMRWESSRTMEILRRQHQALIARAHEQLQVSGDRSRRARTGESCSRTATPGSWTSCPRP